MSHSPEHGMHGGFNPAPFEGLEFGLQPPGPFDGTVSPLQGSQNVEIARGNVEAAFFGQQTPVIDEVLVQSPAAPSPVIAPVPHVETKEVEHSKAKVRQATDADLGQLVDLDRRMFAKAYGSEMPASETVRYMLARRMENIKDGGGWMYVCEVGGQVEGFITIFKTAKSWDAFTSWEDSTNNGTLDGVVDRNSKFAYIANLTVSPQASAHHGRERLFANAFAEGFKADLEYGYFESRMPGFKKWLEAQDVDPTELTGEQLDIIAEEYANTKTTRNGKEVPQDYQIRMYEAVAERGHVLPNAFQDEESLNYGVVFRAKLPRLPKPLRYATAWALQAVGRSPKVASKLF